MTLVLLLSSDDGRGEYLKFDRILGKLKDMVSSAIQCPLAAPFDSRPVSSAQVCATRKCTSSKG